MVSPAREITDSRRRFAAVLAETGRVHAAARASGLTIRAEQNDPMVSRYVQEAVQARLMRLAPVALNVLVRIMNDEKAPVAVRRLAASDILDRAGIVSLAPQATKPESLSAMPAHDLRALVYRLETELFERAKPVESPQTLTLEAKPLSVLD